jgi:diacylglycerol kinase (ATP)
MRVTLFHNPTAGEEETSKEELISLLENAGHEVTYQSTDEDNYEKALTDPGDWVVMAGGDGTVGKILPKMLGSKVRLGLLPSGTANNIARTLGVGGASQGTIENWSDDSTCPFQVGMAEGSWGDKNFIEAVGWGLMALLMKEMDQRKEKQDLSFDNREQELAYARKVLLEISENYPPAPFQIFLDGKDLSGEYLLVEAMNIKSVGPKLDLAPGADPGDGKLDLVLLTEKDRDAFREYVRQRLEGEEPTPAFSVRQGQRLQVAWKGTEAHLDDDLMEEEEGSVEIRLLEPPMNFLRPGKPEGDTNR